MEKELPKPSLMLRICVWLCLPFAYVLKYILTLLLIAFVFGGSFGFSYEYFRSPDVVRGAPADYVINGPAMDEGDIIFTQNLRAKYPDGTKQKTLREKLKISGFDHVGEDSAYFSMRGFPCSRSWGVNWNNNEDGTISAINGTTHFTCL
jgi:hypothetical protein